VRLDELIRSEGDAVALTWRAFLLRPYPEPRDPDEFAAYTTNWARPAEMEPRARFTTPWSSGDPPPSHSLPAAVAAKVVLQHFAASFDDFHHRLMDAYFAENRTISEPSVLTDIAREAGIDGEAFAAHCELDWKPIARSVYDDHNLAVNSGINGVPAVVVADRYLVTGAVDVDHYRAVLDQVREERAGESAGGNGGDGA
jgi:predicted DsbA family dithiol-disulfide isomerase